MTQPLPSYMEGGRIYRNRVHGGSCLADQLEQYRGQGVLVLGIPRGGVPVAAEVARRLDADMDVVVARKLGAPGYPELAIGAVTANGGRFLNIDIIRELHISDAYIEEVSEKQREDARRREERFRGPHAMAEIKGRIVIVVDDGLATGATMRAAVRSVRQREPRRLIAAVPVGSQQACEALREDADEVVCLFAPADFWAVGLYYQDFAPTEDEEVERLLQDSYTRHQAA